MKEDNIVKHKSFDFAVRIIKLYQYLSSDKGIYFKQTNTTKRNQCRYNDKRK